MGSDGYRYLEHITDCIVQAYGIGVEELFENCAKALVGIMFDIRKVECHDSFTITIESNNLEQLLYDWLEKILLMIFVEEIVLASFSVEITKNKGAVNGKRFILRSRVKGEKVSYDKHSYKIEIKAVTYHELKIERKNAQYVATFLVDL